MNLKMIIIMKKMREKKEKEKNKKEKNKAQVKMKERKIFKIWKKESMRTKKPTILYKKKK